MAMELVGGAFLSSLFQSLFDGIASPNVVGFFRQKKLNEKLLRKMKIMLLSVSTVLNDAEKKQIKNQAVKDWLEELKEIIDDSEQLLDEINTEVLRCKVEDEYGSSLCKRLKLNSFSFTTSGRADGVESEIEDILDRLQCIVEQKDLLGLEFDVQNRPLQRLPVPLVEESIVYGRDAEKEKIIECLLSNDIGGEKVSVISIVGMGGIGKTTLAQLIYDDSRVKEKFDIRAWVTVSDEFDVLKITKKMLEILTSPQYFSDDLYQLQVKLKQTLTRKNFLFVFDDVWNESYELWDVLKSPLEYGAHGSKIILTTRSQIVASKIRSILTHNLLGLSNEDCWSLFKKHVLKNIHEHLDLQGIGKKLVVEKCKGHPLAIKFLAGLLGSVRSPKEWRKILENDIWELQLQENSRNNILPALWLSYHYLPANLKRCFAYCSIFPKDYEIQKEKLILLWMAEGLLQPEKGKTMEDVGEQYFQDLISRSLFQPSIQDESAILMHGLVHNLAGFVAGESCFRMESDNMHEIPEKVRHLSYISMRYDAISKFEPLYRAKSLRTFLPLKLLSSENFLTKTVLYELLPSLPCLRVLSLSRYTNVIELPDSIANLKHLRYLDLSHTPIEILPASICTLYNLQTLILSNCSSLTQLPGDIGRLVNLRHLYIDGTNLNEMPQQMSGLKNLQTLRVFGLGKGRGSGIKELKHFGNLRGRLSVSGLENVVYAKDALEANFKDKKHLEELVLKWNINGLDFSNAQEVLEKVQPHINLRKLTIENYGGKAFPNWLGDPSFSNIVSLSLDNCKNCCFLPSLGQLPSLKELLITGFDRLQQMDSELCGRDSSVQPFRSLEILKIEHMAELEEWVVAVGDNDSESFPCLRELHIENCPKLRGNLPHRLSALTELVIVECPQLTASLPVALALSQLEVIHCVNMVLTNIPMQLRWLTIIGLRTTKYLLEEIDYKNSSLEGLSISDCSSLRSLLEGGFPRTLKAVEIRDCRELELSMGHSYAYLESLTLCCSCDSLRSFPLHLFPRLNRLHIEKCYNLESLSRSGEPGQDMKFLHFLQISSCPNFVSFPKGGLPAPNLKWLWIERCDNLKSLPEQMRYILLSLHDLYISDCPELSSFPEGGLPSELRTLSIFSCMKLIASQIKWNLESLTSLEYLSIGRSCVDMECLKQDGRPSLGDCEDLEFFQQGGLVSSTLKSLHISGLCNLESLDYEGLQHLTSLKELKISKCHGLESIALEGLSSSLEFIQISDCPLLKKKYRGKRARDWARIAQNVCMQLDDEVISCE